MSRRNASLSAWRSWNAGGPDRNQRPAPDARDRRSNQTPPAGDSGDRRAGVCRATPRAMESPADPRFAAVARGRYDAPGGESDDEFVGRITRAAHALRAHLPRRPLLVASKGVAACSAHWPASKSGSSQRTATCSSSTCRSKHARPLLGACCENLEDHRADGHRSRRALF